MIGGKFTIQIGLFVSLCVCNVYLCVFLRKNVLREMWEGWWAFSATEGLDMLIACHAADRGLIQMHAPGGAGKLSPDPDRYCSRNRLM